MRYVLVTGTGRSGTSTTARILHQRLGVCMGHEFQKTNGLKKSRNPLGFWEEIGKGMLGWTKQLHRGSLPPEQWLRYLDDAHNRHRCKSALRGYKHPRLANISNEEIWAGLNPLLVIEAWRPRELVLRSMFFASPHSIVERTGCYRMRRRNMDRCLKGVRTFVVRFDRVLSDDEVCEILRPKIEALR